MKTSLFAFGFALVTPALPAAAQQLLSTYTGSVGDEFGAAILQTADQNLDGWPDLIIGAPGWNGGRGYVRALSGRFIATGQGSSVLWTLFSTANAGARFGSSICEVASLTGSIATDYMVGAPGYIGGATTTGALLLVDGGTHTVASTITGETGTQFGAIVVPVGDQDGDGKIDVAANAIPVSSTDNNSKVHIVPGAAFTSGSHALTSVAHWSRNGGWHDHGAALASGFDLDHDGRFDLAVGSPGYGFSNAQAGYVEVCGVNGAFTVLCAYVPPVTGERFGSSIDARFDITGDGVVDFIIGAPNFDAGAGTQVGRALVLSGSSFLHAVSNLELFDLRPTTLSGVHFGACVNAAGDLNHDGVGDFLVGMPDYFSTFPPGSRKGGTQAFSGRTGHRIGSLAGLTNDNLGDALLGKYLDINNDGFEDFAVGGPRSDNSTTNCGALKFYSLFPASWSTYCTAKVNSLGCTPSMFAGGTVSASSVTPFTVECFNVINQVNGLMIYSHRAFDFPFQGGFLCIDTPLMRTLVQNSGGSANGADCTGHFSYDFNALVHSGADPFLLVGAEIFCQYWSRDSASPSTTNLSNGLHFMINP